MAVTMTKLMTVAMTKWGAMTMRKWMTVTMTVGWSRMAVVRKQVVDSNLDLVEVSGQFYRGTFHTGTVGTHVMLMGGGCGVRWVGT